MAKDTYDLTQGDILRKLLIVAYPIMGTQLMQMTYNLTDMFWLGRTENSVTAVAASGLVGMWLRHRSMVGRMGAEIGTSEPRAGDRYCPGICRNSVKTGAGPGHSVRTHPNRVR